MKNYEFIDHTADLALRIYGSTIDDLFKTASYTLFDLLTDYKGKDTQERMITLSADTIEDLLIEWLNELIAVFFADKFLPVDYNIVISEKNDQKLLTASLKGDAFDPYENKIKREIKAATYHEVKIKSCEGGFEAEVIFDV